MITWASAFLSHSSSDKLLVEAVARELGQRGILAWLDKDELYPGQTLTRALTEAIRRQTVLVLFLSTDAVKSPWVDDELDIAFRIEESEGSDGVVIPVCLGNALDLVKSHDRLKSRLLHPDGDRINRFYIGAESLTDTEALAEDIAGKLTRTIFTRLKVKSYRDVLIYIDQRGNGERRGEPENIPPNLQRDLEIAGLVFRPDRGNRSQSDTLHGEEWMAVRQRMQEGLAEALGVPRWVDVKKIRIMGFAQTGLFHLLGRHFNRNTSARLYCGNTDQNIFTNQAQPLGAMALQGGNPHCESPDLPPIPGNSKQDKISLLLATDKFVAPVQKYLEASQDASPLVWVRTDRFDDSDQVMSFIADVVALLSRLRKEHSVQTVCLYNGLPVHVVPLLAANLLHEVDNLVFMEYRRDLQEKQPRPEETYVQLQF